MIGHHTRNDRTSDSSNYIIERQQSILKYSIISETTQHFLSQFKAADAILYIV